MKSKYPVNNLIKLNLWLTTFFFLFGLVNTMADFETANLHKAITSSLYGAIVLILSSFSNLGLLLCFEKSLENDRTKLGKKYLVSSYMLSLLIFVLIIVGYTYIFNFTFPSSIFVYVIIISILMNTLILALQHSILIQDAKAKSDFENSRLKAANAVAANQMLRQQIQPHFLFNALNILKSLYKVNPKAGENYLIRLSDFLRASVSNNDLNVIPLKDEIKLCVDYLEMQKIRFGDALSYTILIPDENTGYVPFFSIQPLVENAIKHNELTIESPLRIEIKQEDDRIIVSNNLKLKNTAEVSTRSGLSNLIERYRLLSNQEIIIENTDSTFSVSIKLLSHEDSNY